MEICYLLAFPDSAESNSHPPAQFKGLKDAPYFQPIDIDLVSLGEETLMERLRMLGWVLLLIGYLYLYALDVRWIHFP